MAGQYVQFNNISVNAMVTDIGGFAGENLQFGWDSHQKQNSGQGFIFGAANAFPNNINTIYDNEVYDTNINDQNVKFGNAYQSV